MKSISFVTFAGIAAALFSIAAHAQTGRPSAVEVPAAADAPHVVAGEQAGSYARYLMLNGATRADALVAARNIDRPSQPSHRVAANRVAAQGDVQATARQ